MLSAISRLSRTTRITLIASTLIGLLFGTATGILVAKHACVAAVTGTVCGLLAGAACIALHDGIRRLGLKRKLCCVLCVLAFAFCGPLVTGFVVASAARHPAGNEGMLAVIGLITIGPLVMAAAFSLLGAYHSRNHD